MQSQNVVNFLKLRASFGMLNTDNIPGNGYWNETVGGGNGYPINNNFGGDGGWHEGRLAFFVGIFRFLTVLYCTGGISCGTIGKPINIM